MALAVLTSVLGTVGATAQDTGQDWPQYVHDASGSGFTSETLINPANASALKPKVGWPVALTNGAVCPSTSDVCSNMIFAQPVVATVSGATLVYVGSWNGSEYALCASSCTVGQTTYSTGQVVWQAYLGRSSACGGPLNSAIRGVTSTATVANVAIGGVTRPVVFVGGGGDIRQDGTVATNAAATTFALNALTGAILWVRALGSAPATYSWSSPLYANGGLYVGIASQGDCPLVQGKVVELDPGTGATLHEASMVPTGCLGASVWGSPSADSSGNVYVATGNGGSCTVAEGFAQAVLKLSPTLRVKSHWQIPAAEAPGDSDFGSTPTLFSGTVTPTGTLSRLLGVPNKNGIYYVFNLNSISAGPVQRLRVAVGGGDARLGSISPSSWDGSKLYVAGGSTTINGTTYAGSLRAFNPNNLSSSPLWQDGFTSSAVLGAVTSDPGLAIVGLSGPLRVVNSATGATSYKMTGGFEGSASIAHGVIYIGDKQGQLQAFSVNGL